tara:strand:+ start:15928 stop:16662 length:735 start_codon:yes stop_codon:yes gene_type:complete
MNIPLRIGIFSIFILCLNTIHVSAENLSQKLQGRKLIENSLNNGDLTALSRILPEGESENLIYQYREFIESFPNSNWTVNSKYTSNKNEEIIYINVNGSKKLGSQTLQLSGKQSIKVLYSKNRILNKEIISSESMLTTFKNKAPFLINIPDNALTGSIYEIDIIYNKPLENSILAGGLIYINNNELKQYISPRIEIEPLAAGGLFKQVKAPQSPGKQNWAALIAHPDGLISITKTVNIVDGITN